MIQAPGGVLVKSPTILWEGDTRSFQGAASLSLGNRYASYSQLYREQMWVATVVDKLAMGTARLPLKTYLRDDLNRPDASDTPYGQLLMRPNQKHSRFFFWLWVSSTYDVYGEAFLGKIRDPGGRPIQLAPLHPTAMHPDDVDAGAEQTWTFRNGTIEIKGIRQSDIVHFKTYNPDSTLRGLSKLERLRRTLEFEDAAQRAQSSFWRNGARPGVALIHPGNLSDPAAERLKVRWDAVASGADKTGTTVVLEEGLKPEIMTVSNDEAQYIESRKLNREEVCAGYDIPPPVVHILDRATFSNITEQMRSIYRDTQAPRLQMFESTLEHDLRSSVRPGATEPDFGDDVYAEFLLDEVLRGDFEVRADGYQKGINSGWITPAEVRRLENLPFVTGSDRLMVNSTIKPLDEGTHGLPPQDLAAMLQKLYLSVDVVISAEEARALLNEAGADLGPTPELGAAPRPVPADLRSVMGRLSRTHDLADVDPMTLTADVAEPLASLVRAAHAVSTDAGHTVPEFRGRLKAITGG